jgi:tRNA isopentenyl-2-thiomethyl-A-37 hydroxylase MiaE
MKTSTQWLSEIKSNPFKLIDWLQRQYIGEVLASQRISQLAEDYPQEFKILSKIALDEYNHAELIKTLLINRNIKLPTITDEDVRYWKPILGNLHSFEEIAGAGHHAEAMRLVRIKLLAEDSEIAEDIRLTFKSILKDEEWHSSAFKNLSTPSAIESTKIIHEEGLNMLGLVL